MSDNFNSNNVTGTFLDPTSAKTGLALCLTAYAGYGIFAVGIAMFRPDARNKTTDFFITARNSQSVWWSAASWFASAMGAWTLYGPAAFSICSIDYSCESFLKILVGTDLEKGVITMTYTSIGGLYVSIITDMVQTVLVLVLVIVTAIYMAVTFRNEPLPPLPEYLGATTAGWKTIATIAIPLTCATFFGEAFWQRVWSAKDNKSLKAGALIGGSLATIVVFILGFGGMLAYWSGRALEESNSNYAFFYAFADPHSGNISAAIIILVILFASVMDESAVDSMQNAITDTLTTFASFFGFELGFVPVRCLVILANIPIMVGAAYLTTSGVSILNAYGVANMLTTMTFAPLAAGLIPQLNNYLTAFSALGSCVGAFFATMAYGVVMYDGVYDGMTALWWTSAYDWEGYLISFFSSIAFIPLLIGVEFAVRAAMGWPFPVFNGGGIAEEGEKVEGSKLFVNSSTKHPAHTLALYTTKAVIVLDSEGKRLLAKYYSPDYPTLKEQRVFEKALFDKTKKLNSEIVLLDNQVIVYKNSHDIFIYFVGTMDENELILMSALQSFYEALSMLLAGQVEKRSILESADLVFLALDETIDDGIILESDSTQIAARVTKKDANEGSSMPSTEQTIAQALRQAQEQFARSLLK
ncbi:UNVERIFIED_CONTAM: Coatomer subunit zeta-1 [Siphonaria sp. JEL0065]|nr:Coatomer subunit zeta-1 [Siphonaria sp. JEL0065]